MPLKYLFSATFKDGTVIKQTQKDESATTLGKNCFYDVLQRMSEVVKFELVEDNWLSGKKVSIDLLTGLFTVGGVEFIASDPSLISNLRDVEGFRLVYFKRHRHTLTNGVETNHEIEYHLGWQTTLDGKNYQQTIALS